jgi:class 3 adenylate cyclase
LLLLSSLCESNHPYPAARLTTQVGPRNHPLGLADELHRGTVTFLFTDIEGSTELLKTLGGERYHDVLIEHQRLLRAAFAGSGGREVDTQGDAFFVAFPKARDAVTAAVAAQRALLEAEWPDRVQVRVRVGIDTGEPVAGQGRYVGLGVHRTARIMAAGHGGQILLSRTTRDLILDELPTDTSLRDLAEKRLKDLDNDVHLCQLLASGLPSKFPRNRRPRSPDASAAPVRRRPRDRCRARGHRRGRAPDGRFQRD